MDIGNVQELIHTLESLNPDSPEAYDETVASFRKMGQIPFFAGVVPAPITLFKTRTHQNDVLFEEYADIGVAPPSAITSFARCNRPGQQVIYGADFRPTSYMELLESWIENKSNNPIIYATIGKWNITKPLNVLIVSSPNPKERICSYDKVQGAQLDLQLKAMNKESQTAARLFYQYMFDKIRKSAKKDTKTYIVTTAYSNLALNSKANIDGVYFPSVPYGGKGVNLAIRGDFDFASFFELELVARDTFIIDDSGNLPSYKQYAPIRQAVSVDVNTRKIIW